MTVIVVGYSERQALLWLSDKVQADLDPALTTAELRRLLAVAAITDANGNLPDSFERWVANTVYGIGDRIVPSVRNGSVYIATIGGQAGTTEPTFPTTVDLTVTDGAVTWACEDTAEWVPTYAPSRLNTAAAEGWRIKIAKLMVFDNFSADGLSVDMSRRRADMLEMVKLFDRKGGIGTIKLQGRTAQVDTDIRTNVVIAN